MIANTTSRLLLLILLVSACENGPWAADGARRAGSTDHAGPATAYQRHIVFLGFGPELPAAATFDFGTIADSSGVQRTAHARLAIAGRWDSLLDESWSMAPMREPWRILPRNGLRVIVTDAGELGALVHADPLVRIEAGGLIAESSPDGGTQLVLRGARMATSDSSYTGLLLDAQAGQSVDDLGAPAPGDGVAALLAHGSDYQIVLAPSAGDLLAWVHDAGETRILRQVQLLAETSDGQTDSRAVWTVEGGGELTGRIQAAVPARTDGGGDRDGYVLVSGWIEDAGVRRDVFGLVRNAR